MRLLFILPVLMLACTSGSGSWEAYVDPDEYLDRVRRMHAENRAQFKHLTTVTFAPPVAQTSSDPNESAPTYDEWKLYVLSGLIPHLTDLSKASTFLWAQLNDLNTMAVPDEHTGLHADLVAMWEAGIAWVDDRLKLTQDHATAFHMDDSEAYDEMDRTLNSSEDMERRNSLIDRHANAVNRVNFVLLGTPEPSPFSASGTSTAWALKPFPDVPTATLDPAPTPTAEYVDPSIREEAVRRYADDACGPEKLDYPAIGWPKLAGELAWTIQLLRFDPPRGLGGFRDVLWDYYETLKLFAEEQDRSLKVDEALFMSDEDVIQKRMDVVKAIEGLPEADQLALRGAGCIFD